MVRPCLLIPIYNHGQTIAGVVGALAALELPCIIVDDGSCAPTRAALEAVAAEHAWVEVLRRPANGGRGAALRDGYRRAAERGFTHAAQLDADGQHDPGSIPALLAEARRNPDALILGAPRFDASAPRARRYGRMISQVWVWIETLSFAIRDPLCGLRCFPLAPTLRLLDRRRLGDRMDFDPEVVVRLCWDGVPIRNVPTHVRYFEGGLSTFDLLWDNVRISWMHTRLVCGMLARLPWLLGRRGARALRRRPAP